MRPSRTLSLYVAREIVVYALLGLLAFAVILVSNNVVRHLDLLAAAQFSFSTSVTILTCLVAMLIPPAVPMAFLFGVLLGVGRLASESEFLAMRASGQGLRALLLPVLALAVVISGISAWLMLEVEPSAKRELRNVKFDLATGGTLLEPGRFYRRFGDRVLFAAASAPGNRLSGIMISDRSDPARPLLILAEEGVLAFDTEEVALHFVLDRGEIHLEPVDPADEAYRQVAFERFDYALDARELVGESGGVKPSEMSLVELRSVLARARQGDPLEDLRTRDPRSYEIQIHRRFALPTAPIVFGLIGVLLGLLLGRGARAAGALVSVLVLGGYYVLMGFSEEISKQGQLPVALAMWLPNIVFALAAIPLLWRSSRDHG